MGAQDGTGMKQLKRSSPRPAGRQAGADAVAGRARVAGMPAANQRRYPLLVVGGIVLTAVATVVVLAALNVARAQTLVWSTAADVDRGQPVTAQQLVAVEVAAETAGSLLAATVESRQQLVRRVWVADLPAGQLLSPALTVERLEVAEGRALVGLRLEPGALPTVGLRPGDVVAVVAEPPQPGGPAQMLVDRAVVEAVTVLSDQGVAAARLVTVAVPDGRAAEVAAAAGAGRVALAVVPPGGRPGGGR